MGRAIIPGFGSTGCSGRRWCRCAARRCSKASIPCGARGSQAPRSPARRRRDRLAAVARARRVEGVDVSHGLTFTDAAMSVQAAAEGRASPSGARRSRPGTSLPGVWSGRSTSACRMISPTTWSAPRRAPSGRASRPCGPGCWPRRRGTNRSWRSWRRRARFPPAGRLIERPPDPSLPARFPNEGACGLMAPDLTGLLQRLVNAVERLAPPTMPGPTSRRPTPSCGRPRRNSCGPWRRCPACRSSCWSGSIACATCSTTPSGSRPADRPTTRCCGAPAAWARAR